MSNVCLIILLLTGIQAQIPTVNQCICSCCLGEYCPVSVVGTIPMQNCTTEMCLSQCRCTYPPCSANPPYGLTLGQCSLPVNNLFNCQCVCCNTGLFTCTPTLVGYTTSNLCQPAACAISCYKQYPYQCVSDSNGQTQGTCISPVTTTTPMTTIIPWLGYICSCLYCQYGSTCTSNIILGVTSASQCSSLDCTQSCQNRYQSTICSTNYLNQINGVCLTQGKSKLKCKCNCCRDYGCVNYDINTNDTCSSCYTKCQQLSPCINSPTITYTCVSNISTISYNSFLLISILLFIFYKNSS